MDYLVLFLAIMASIAANHYLNLFGLLVVTLIAALLFWYLFTTDRPVPIIPLRNPGRYLKIHKACLGFTFLMMPGPWIFALIAFLFGW
ncbi:MAG: hypothetical protein HYT12_01215 [Candidatus Liptonbacteria bacterium]|nr:hypothetical protein [Candidatus Liptonbacteria bacterium]